MKRVDVSYCNMLSETQERLGREIHVILWLVIWWPLRLRTFNVKTKWPPLLQSILIVSRYYEGDNLAWTVYYWSLVLLIRIFIPGTNKQGTGRCLRGCEVLLCYCVLVVWVEFSSSCLFIAGCHSWIVSN